jgi:hypothetical protein
VVKDDLLWLKVFVREVGGHDELIWSLLSCEVKLVHW